MSETIPCNICKKPLEEDFCSICGQQRKKTKVTVWSMITDLFVSIVSLERSAFAGVLSILIDPKRLVDLYEQGYRKYHPSPGKVFFLALAVAALHFAYVDKTLMGANFDLNNVKASITFWIIFFPILLLVSWLSFIRKKLSFTRHIISLLYVGSTWLAIITVTQDLINFLEPDMVTAEASVFFFFITLIWNARANTTPATVGRIALNSLIQFVVFGAVIALLVFLIYLGNPESVDIG